jgi:hypothetical protein
MIATTTPLPIESCPEPMVPRSSYRRVVEQLTSERVAFLKETLLLRQQIARLESKKQEKEQRDFTNAVAKENQAGSTFSGGPLGHEPQSPFGFGNTTLPFLSSTATPQSTTRTGVGLHHSLHLKRDSGSNSPASPPLHLSTGAMPQSPTAASYPTSLPLASYQLVAIDSITHALNAASSLSSVQAEIQERLEDAKAEHQKELKVLQDQHAAQLMDLEDRLEEQRRRLAMLNATMKIEKVRYKAKAEANAQMTVEKLTAEKEKLEKDKASLNQELESVQERLRVANAEIQRQGQLNSQLRQQVNILTQERGELRGALVKMNTEVMNGQEQIQLQARQIANLENQVASLSNQVSQSAFAGLEASGQYAPGARKDGKAAVGREREGGFLRGTDTHSGLGSSTLRAGAVPTPPTESQSTGRGSRKSTLITVSTAAGMTMRARGH